MSKNKKVIVIGAVFLAIVLVAAALVITMTKPETQEGSKTITVTVMANNETVDVHEISTDEEYLRGALEQEGIISGEESEYGLYVLTVCEVTANEQNQEWWCFTKGGEQLNTGVDDTPIANGDAFEATLMVGW